MAAAAQAAPAGTEVVPLNQLWMASDALAKTKQMRNYFQLERDKINAYWEITKKELEAIRAERRNKDREIEEMHERHKVEMKVYKQKARHLLYEHKVQIAQLKTESERALHNKLQEHRAKEADLKKDKRQLKQEWKGQQLQHEEQLFRMRQDYDKELTQLKQSFERKMKEMQMKYEKRIKNLREEMELKRKAEIDDIETRKTAHIKDLMAAHDRAFQDIREYYNDITSNNLELIKNLKDNVSTMKRNEAYNEKLMFEIAQENKRLTEPLTKALKEVNLLNHDLTNYEKDKQHLKSAKHRLQQLEEAHKTKEWEFEVLTQRFDAVKAEVDKLYEKYRGTVSNLQKNAMFRHVLLKKKVEVTSTQLEKKDAQLGEVIKASNLEAGTAATVERQLEDMLNDKNTLIEGLQRSLAEITERHEVMVNEYESHLGDHGVKGLR